MNSLQTTIQWTRRRWVWNLALAQSALAVAAALGGLILLLVVGTQVLDWYWLVAIFAGTLLFGAFRIARRIPSDYVISQMLDRRIASHDVLSTAWYFAQPDCRGSADEAVKAAQRETAAKLAEAVDVPRATPFTLPRAAYAVVVLLVVAGSLLGLRYGIHRSLDLRPPIAQAVFDFFHPDLRERSGRDRTAQQKRARDLLQEGINPLDDPTNKLRAGEPNFASASPDATEMKGADPEFRKLSAKSEAENNEPESSDEPGEGTTFGSDKASDENAANGQPGKPPEKKPPGVKPPPPSEEESSLLQKMREAMANLLDKLKIQPPTGGEGQEATKSAQSGMPSARSEKGADPNGKPMPGKPQSGAQEAKPGEGQQADAQQAPGGKSKGERGGEESAAQEGSSGIGREDGDKGLRDAENLAAMGKLSEILGKRSQNISGEMMVEVSSGKQQQLKTPYSGKAGAHAEAGGEIHRDEVPLVYQQYVQQYFEEVRKTPPAKAEK